MLRAFIRFQNVTRPLRLPLARTYQNKFASNFSMKKTEAPKRRQPEAKAQQEEQVESQVDTRNEGISRQPNEIHSPRQYANSLTRTSRTVSYILRHGARKEGLALRPDGYVKVDDLLKIPKLQQLGFVELEILVREDQKKRYNLIYEPAPTTWREGAESHLGPVWWIRANQGHSLQDVEVEMKPITDPSQCPIVVHGTNHRAWESIKKNGLSKMGRNHIHFAQGLPGTKGVISGMRNQASVLIFVDLAKALTDGFEFSISQNGVVLCAGNEKGFLPPEYFLRVETAWKNYPLPGYEFPKECEGKKKLAIFDESHAKNMESLGYKARRRFKWADPIQGILDTDSTSHESKS